MQQQAYLPPPHVGHVEQKAAPYNLSHYAPYNPSLPSAPLTPGSSSSLVGGSIASGSTFQPFPYPAGLTQQMPPSGPASTAAFNPLLVYGANSTTSTMTSYAGTGSGGGVPTTATAPYLYPASASLAPAFRPAAPPLTSSQPWQPQLAQPRYQAAPASLSSAMGAQSAAPLLQQMTASAAPSAPTAAAALWAQPLAPPFSSTAPLVAPPLPPPAPPAAVPRSGPTSATSSKHGSSSLQSQLQQTRLTSGGSSASSVSRSAWSASRSVSSSSSSSSSTTRRSASTTPASSLAFSPPPAVGPATYIAPAPGQRSSVKQLAAQLGSSLGISTQPQPTPVGSASTTRPAHGASSARPLPQNQQPQGTAGGEPRLMLPKSGTDEALLPMAMGQALVWKQWEDKGTTYHDDAELAQRLQAEQDREDARKRAEARQAAEARSSARGPSTAVSDAQFARVLQEAERANAAPRPAATTLNAQGLTDAEIAAVLQEEEEAMARARLRRNQRTNY